MDSRPRRWRSGLQLAILGVVVSIVTTIVSLASTSRAFQTPEEQLTLVVSLGATGFILSPFMVFPPLVLAHLAVWSLPTESGGYRIFAGGAIGVLVGFGLFGAGASFFFGAVPGGLFFIPPVVTGAVIGIGWGWVLRHEQKPYPSVADLQTRCPNYRQERDGADTNGQTPRDEEAAIFSDPPRSNPPLSDP